MLGVLFALGPLACADGAPGPRGAGGGGDAPVRVVNDVGQGFELDRLVLAVDGVDLPVSAIPPAGHPAGATTTLHLAPGEHALTARALASASSTGGRAGDRVVVGSQQGFRTTDAPLLLVVRVYTRRRRPTRWASASPWTCASATERWRRTRARAGLPWSATCATRPSYSCALQRRDVVLASCVRDKLAEMRRLADLREGTGASETAALVEQRVGALSRRVDTCVGDEANLLDDAVALPDPPAGAARPSSTRARR